MDILLLECMVRTNFSISELISFKKLFIVLFASLINSNEIDLQKRVEEGVEFSQIIVGVSVFINFSGTKHDMYTIESFFD